MNHAADRQPEAKAEDVSAHARDNVAYAQRTTNNWPGRGKEKGGRWKEGKGIKDSPCSR